MSLECKTDLSPTVVDSVTWKNNNPALKNVLRLNPLTVHNMYLTYFCEIRYNFRMIQKAYRLNVSSIGGKYHTNLYKLLMVLQFLCNSTE